MMQARITVKDTGAARFKYNVHRAFNRRLERFGKQHENIMKALVGKPSPNKFKVHAPPGEPPYLQTGALYDAITHQVEVKANTSHLYVGIPRRPRARVRYKTGRRKTRNIPVWVYANIVEYGLHNLKAPHPFLSTTMLFAKFSLKDELLKRL